MSEFAIGIDLGATKLASALVDAKGRVVRKHQSATPKGVTALMEAIGHHVTLLSEGQEERIAGVGIGAPGWHDQETGMVEGAVNLSEGNFDLREGLRGRFDYPLFHATDAHAEALGEWLFGAGQGSRHMVYFGVGSGLGSGLILDGKLFAGANGIAGNMAHFAYGFEGEGCGCGLWGCLENAIGGLAVPNLIESLNLSGEFPERELDVEMPNEELLQMALAGDAMAKAVFEKMGTWLGVALSVAIAMINPDCVVIGGGIGRAAFDLLERPMIGEAQRRTIPIAWRALQVRKSAILSSAVGAACLVWHGIDDE